MDGGGFELGLGGTGFIVGRTGLRVGLNLLALRVIMLFNHFHFGLTLLITATDIPLILEYMRKYLIPDLPVIKLVDNLLSQYHFINILFAQYPKLSLNNRLIVFHLRHYIHCSYLVLFVRVLYAVVLFAAL